MDLTDKFTPEYTVKFVSLISNWRSIYNGICASTYTGNIGVIGFELNRFHEGNSRTYIIKADFGGNELGKYDSTKHEFPDSIKKVEAIFKRASKQKEVRILNAMGI